MKPIIRWTLGPCSQEALNCYEISVRSIKRCYGNKFEMYCCQNNRKLHQINGVKNIKQTVPPCFSTFVDGPQWKLCPPRINKDVHEIFMDNDLILHKQIEEIDSFLSSNSKFIATEGFRRRFGSYDNLIKPEIKINTGLFGLPPKFDFSKFLEKFFCGQWNSVFDEQGLVSVILSRQDLTIISLNKVKVCAELLELGSHGCHFVGLNKGHKDFFIAYKKLITQPKL